MTLGSLYTFCRQFSLVIDKRLLGVGLCFHNNLTLRSSSNDREYAAFLLKPESTALHMGRKKYHPSHATVCKSHYIYTLGIWLACGCVLVSFVLLWTKTQTKHEWAEEMALWFSFIWDKNRISKTLFIQDYAIFRFCTARWKTGLFLPQIPLIILVWIIWIKGRLELSLCPSFSWSYLVGECSQICLSRTLYFPSSCYYN